MCCLRCSSVSWASCVPVSCVSPHMMSKVMINDVYIIPSGQIVPTSFRRDRGYCNLTSVLFTYPSGPHPASLRLITWRNVHKSYFVNCLGWAIPRCTPPPHLALPLHCFTQANTMHNGVCLSSTLLVQVPFIVPGSDNNTLSVYECVYFSVYTCATCRIITMQMPLHLYIKAICHFAL